jgi:hypothetical protein
MKYQIETYLKNKHSPFDSKVTYGTCNTCNTKAAWGRRELSSHKRSGNCVGQTEAERNMFKNEQLVSSSAMVQFNF